VSTREKVALVLGAGAPNSPLMAGALAAMYKRGKTFDIIYTTGGGAVIGLLFVAPNGKGPYEALRGIVEMMGVHDLIYSLIPIGYKTFFKPGPFTRPFRRLGQLVKIKEFPLGPIPAGVTSRQPDVLRRYFNERIENWMKYKGGQFTRLYNDLVDLWVSILTPSTTNPFSQGMCAPFPFFDEMVDFSKLLDFPGQFYMNAWNVTDSKMDIFTKGELTPAHFRAALAYPSIYPPAEVNGKFYFEGADHDPLNFGNLTTRVDRGHIKTVMVIDILGSLEPYLVRRPRSLWDAYGISIMTPVVALARKNLEHFENYQNRDEKGKPIFELLKLKFPIPESLQPHIMEWSYSNLSHLWDIGYVVGEKFCEDNWEKIPDRRIYVDEPLVSAEEE
jgi:NTE family protein